MSPIYHFTMFFFFWHWDYCLAVIILIFSQYVICFKFLSLWNDTDLCKTFSPPSFFKSLHSTQSAFFSILRHKREKRSVNKMSESLNHIAKILTYKVNHKLHGPQDRWTPSPKNQLEPEPTPQPHQLPHTALWHLLQMPAVLFWVQCLYTWHCLHFELAALFSLHGLDLDFHHVPPVFMTVFPQSSPCCRTSGTEPGCYKNQTMGNLHVQPSTKHFLVIRLRIFIVYFCHCNTGQTSALPSVINDVQTLVHSFKTMNIFAQDRSCWKQHHLLFGKGITQSWMLTLLLIKRDKCHNLFESISGHLFHCETGIPIFLTRHYPSSKCQ